MVPRDLCRSYYHPVAAMPQGRQATGRCCPESMNCLLRGRLEGCKHRTRVARGRHPSQMSSLQPTSHVVPCAATELSAFEHFMHVRRKFGCLDV